MPRLKRNIQRLSVYEVEPFVLSKELRTSLANTLAHKIPASAWVRIFAITTLYQRTIHNESFGVSIDDFQAKMGMAKSAIQTLRRDLSVERTAIELPTVHELDPVRSFTISKQIMEDVHRKFFEIRGPYGDPWTIMYMMLEHGLDALEALLDWVAYEHSAPDFKGVREGGIWNFWVIGLTQIMKDHDLPYKVSKMKSRTGMPSPFAKFFWDLQELLPADQRRHTHGEDGFFSAIVRARSGISFEGNFDEKFGSMLPELRGLLGKVSGRN